jgi:hypothetical protein
LLQALEHQAAIQALEHSLAAQHAATLALNDQLEGVREEVLAKEEVVVSHPVSEPAGCPPVGSLGALLVALPQHPLSVKGLLGGTKQAAGFMGVHNNRSEH